MKLAIKKGTTDVSVYLFIQDSSATDGSGLTSLVYNSASLVCYYVRPLAAAAQLTLATQTVTGAHSDGGFVEVDATNMPGVYRLDLSDAICASGVDSVVVMLKGATNMAPVTLEIQLTDVDLNDAVRGGMTALPNANADAAGGLVISDAGGLDIDTLNSNVSAVLVDTGTTIPASISALNDLSAAQVNAEVVDALNVDTYAEPGQGAPAATTSLAAKINYLYKAWRNKTTQTASTYTLYADDTTTTDQAATVSDDGTTFTRGEIGTGA